MPPTLPATHPLPRLIQVLGSVRAPALAIGLALLMSAIAAGYVARQQAELIGGDDLYQAEFGPWAAFQLEGEALRLSHAISDYLEVPGNERLEAMRLRSEILLSRLALVSKDALNKYPAAAPRRDAVLAIGRRFPLRADAVLGPASAQPPRPGELRALRAELDEMAEPLQLLTLAVQQESWRLADEVRQRLQRHQRDSILLTLLQVSLTIALAAVALRKLHQLHQRRHLDALADERQHARLTAEQANRAKSTFLANMSHELRTPFHGMLGMLALLERTRLDARQADFVRTAQSSARHLLDILNDILDISKLESGQLSIVAGRVALGPLLDEVERLMRPLAQDKGLVLRLERDAALPLAIQCDGMRLKQILFNLIGNAVKFTPRGLVSLEVHCRPLAVGSATSRLVIDVRDTGPGMDDATLARLFNRFQQGDDTISRQQGGTGLGLEISRSLARMMGGNITVVSTPGLGSCFTLALDVARLDGPGATGAARTAAGSMLAAPPPIAPMAPLPPEPAGPAAPAAGSRPAAPMAAAGSRPAAPMAAGLPVLPGLRVLVSEDHEVNQKYLAELLELM